jgi:hypothetical protein
MSSMTVGKRAIPTSCVNGQSQLNELSFNFNFGHTTRPRTADVYSVRKLSLEGSLSTSFCLVLMTWIMRSNTRWTPIGYTARVSLILSRHTREKHPSVLILILFQPHHFVCRVVANYSTQCYHNKRLRASSCTLKTSFACNHTPNLPGHQYACVSNNHYTLFSYYVWTQCIRDQCKVIRVI